MINRLTPLCVLSLYCLSYILTGCYSFKSTSIGPGISTFYVDNFGISAPSAPANINLDFTTDLREKIEQQSSLRFVEQEADITFSGNINTYQVRSVAPTADNTSSFDRLTISIKVDYEEKVDEDKNWSQNFSFYRDFDSDENLIDNQEDYIEEIFDQLTEDIFNKSFTNW